ncbi:MAG: TniQ family protein [Acidobacteria bacterium]|nr:TniQ family protein [Acidobacteriota bacterium]
MPPIGVGTPRVESFTGYIARLAEAHGIEVGSLVNHVLLHRIPKTNGLFAGHLRSKSQKWWIFDGAHALNGVGMCPRHWVSALEELTGVKHLDLLTLFPWADRLSRTHLLRTIRAWCPECYQGWRTAGLPVYEPLLWMFQIVTICPFHRRILEQNCPVCGRTQYVFSSKSRPGFCSRCRSWLAPNQSAAAASETTDGNLSEQIWVAEKVGELLAANHRIFAQVNADIFRENVRQFINAADCTLKWLREVTKVDVRVWLCSTSRPRIDTLLKLCGLWRISPLRLLTEPIPRDDHVWHRHIVEDHRPAERINASSASLFKTGRRPNVSRAVVVSTLEDALAKDFCTLLREVAASLGLRTIRRFYADHRLSELAHAIAAKNARLRKRSHDFDYRGSTKPLRMLPALTCSDVRHFAGVPRSVVMKALEDALAKDSYTRLKAVAASAGLNDTKRFYLEKPLSDLAHAIAAKNAELKRHGNAREESSLTEALNRAMASSRTKIKRVPRAVVQRGLEDALTEDTYISLRSVAASLGLRSVARFYRDKSLSELVHAIVAKNTELWKGACNIKDARHLPGVPRDVVRRALEKAVANDSYTTVGSVAASLGLRSTRRLYKEKCLADLAHAIAAKNATIKKRHYEEVMLSLATAPSEKPERSIADVARRVSREAKSITERVPKVKPARPHGPQGLFPPSRQAYRLNEALHELEAALLEDPAPAFFTVLKRLRIEPQAIRQTFPRICRSLRDRYKRHKEDARAQEHKAFEVDVREALMILQHADIQPTYRRIITIIQPPRFRSRKILNNAISLVREELSSGLHTVRSNLSMGFDGKSVPHTL